MNSLRIIAFALAFAALGGQAQEVSYVQGLYKNADGSLYTGSLETIENNDTRVVLEIKEGYRNGSAHYYFSSGKLMEKGHFENGMKTGNWIRFNENGGTVAVGPFLAGKKHGTWLVYDDKGNKTFEMHYVNGEKAGTWYNWDTSGQLLSSKSYGAAN